MKLLCYFVVAFVVVIRCYSQPVSIKNLHSRYGDATVKIVGDLLSKDKTPVIVLPGAAAESRDEWLPIVNVLVKKMDCVCAILYLDSIAKPWVVKDILEIIETHVFHNTLRANRAILLGKSFGGLLAHEYAIHYPKHIIALVLFAPASNDRNRIQRLCTISPPIPIFLGWTGDDLSYSHHLKFQHHCKSKVFKFYRELYGGHEIMKEYHAPIFEFLSNYTYPKKIKLHF